MYVVEFLNPLSQHFNIKQRGNLMYVEFLNSILWIHTSHI